MRMGLQSLVGISLEQIAPARETIKRLLDAAARHIADTKVNAISAETRFMSAYTAIQTLPTTLGVDSQTLIRFDKLRKQRNKRNTPATSFQNPPSPNACPKPSRFT